MIQKIEIANSKSFKYLREELDRGRTLCNYLSQLPIEKGKVFTFAPSEASEKQMLDFESGGLYPFDKELLKTSNLILVRKDARPIVINEIKNYLSARIAKCKHRVKPMCRRAQSYYSSIAYHFP